MVFTTKELQEFTEKLYELKFQGERTTKEQIENILKEVIVYERNRIIERLLDMKLADMPISVYLSMIWNVVTSPKNFCNYMCHIALNYARYIVLDKELPEYHVEKF